MLLLILSQLVFLSERQQWQIGQVTQGMARDASCREFGLVEGGNGPDVIKLSL